MKYFLSGMGVMACLSGMAQAGTADNPVQVSREPLHHKVLDNAWVRLLDVHIPAGDTSLWHKHSTPSVFLVLSNTKTGSEVRVEPGKPSFAGGNIWFEGFYDQVRIHRVWNEDTVEFHVIDMELPHSVTGKAGAPVTDGPLQLLFDEKPVRGYRMSMTVGTNYHLTARPTPVVVIGLSTGGEVAVNTATFTKKGDYLFVPAGTAIHFENTGEVGAELGVFELK